MELGPDWPASSRAAAMCRTRRSRAWPCPSQSDRHNCASRREPEVLLLPVSQSAQRWDNGLFDHEPAAVLQLQHKSRVVVLEPDAQAHGDVKLALARHDAGPGQSGAVACRIALDVG